MGQPISKIVIKWSRDGCDIERQLPQYVTGQSLLVGSVVKSIVIVSEYIQKHTQEHP